MAPDASWKAVPEGFHVAWREVDLSVFERRSRIAARLAAVRQGVTGVFDAARIACAVLGWRALDQLAQARSRMRRRSAAAVAATRRIIRLGPPKLPQGNWKLTVQITVGQDNERAPQRLAA